MNDPTVAVIGLGRIGLPPIEAMACGLPVVVTDIPVFRETVSDAGTYVDPLSPRSWYEALKTLLLDEGMRNYLSKKGLARAQRFKWRYFSVKLAKLYLELLHG